MNTSKNCSIIILILVLIGCQTKQKSTNKTVKENTKVSAAIAKATYTYMAIDDFQSSSNLNDIPFYQEIRIDALAVDPTIYPDLFATAEMVFEEEESVYDFSITTMLEVDGESSYRLLINGEVIGNVTNPEKSGENIFVHSFGQSILKPGDTIRIQANNHSNKKYMNGSQLSYARGRWSKLILTKQSQ
ncbi:MAG: hypothetical protein JXR07_01545 [Reichenbachiella sp.]